MIKSLIAIVAGLVIITIYNNKDDLTSGNSQSLFYFTSSVNHDLSLDSLGDTFSIIDWANPIQITKNGIPTSQTESIVQIDNDSIAKVDEMQIISAADSDLVEQQLEQIAQISPENETENIDSTLLESIETKEQTESVPVLVQPESKENANGTKNPQQDIDVLIKKALDNQTQIFAQKLEKELLLLNKSQREINTRMYSLESNINDFNNGYLNLIEDIDQIKVKLEKIENNEIAKQDDRQNNIKNNSTISQPQEQNNGQNEAQNDNQNNTTNTNDQIESIAETIAATRKLLESLEIDSNQIEVNQPNQSTPENIVVNEINSDSDIPMAINEEKTEPLSDNIANETESTNNEQNAQEMKTFAKGMLQYAIDLAKNSQTEKAYEIMKQIEPVLSEDLDYLLKMAELNKQMTENDLAIAYYKKAAILATLRGDYGAFQEVIGNVMSLDMLTAGDLINKYSSRFENNNNP